MMRLIKAYTCGGLQYKASAYNTYTSLLEPILAYALAYAHR